jgi:mitogen-activated protein kinase 1/3
MTHDSVDVVLALVWEDADQDEDEFLNSKELCQFIKNFIWDTQRVLLKNGSNLQDFLLSKLNAQFITDDRKRIQELEELLKKFRQDPQDSLDKVREIFGIADKNSFSKKAFMRGPRYMTPIFGQSRRFSTLMSGAAHDEDGSDELLSADDLNRMSRKVGMEQRKSRSVARQPDSITSLDSHRGKGKKLIDNRPNAKKKKKRRRGQKHFPEADLGGKYEFVKYLGHGSYGHVCEAKRLSDGERVALKKVDKIFGNIIDAKRFLREIRVLRTLRDHEAIVDLLDILPPEEPSTFNCLYLVFEFVDTDLHHLIGTEQFFSALHCQYMLYQILLALKYMHTGKLVHRDLKPANILINEDCSVKLCDFGLARGYLENVDKPHPHTHILVENKEDKANESKMKLNRDLTRHIVTRWYRAPEVILITQDREYLPRIDMWSIGCIMSELLQMQKENVPDAAKREPLFPGKSCFPLSAKDPFAYQDRMDQLNVIFEVIGTPSKETIKECCNEQCQRYLLSLPKREKASLKSKFPGTSEAGLDLLQTLLNFDYRKRYTAEEALAHPYFNDVRDNDAEIRHENVNFDFEDIKLEMKTLRELIVDEVLLYNPEMLRAASTYTIDS